MIYDPIAHEELHALVIRLGGRFGTCFDERGKSWTVLTFDRVISDDDICKIEVLKRRSIGFEASGVLWRV